jgi:hypothetical protein
LLTNLSSGSGLRAFQPPSAPFCVRSERTASLAEFDRIARLPPTFSTSGAASERGSLANPRRTYPLTQFFLGVYFGKISRRDSRPGAAEAFAALRPAKDLLLRPAPDLLPGRNPLNSEFIALRPGHYISCFAVRALGHSFHFFA